MPFSLIGVVCVKEVWSPFLFFFFSFLLLCCGLLGRLFSLFSLLCYWPRKAYDALLQLIKGSQVSCSSENPLVQWDLCPSLEPLV